MSKNKRSRKNRTSKSTKNYTHFHEYRVPVLDADAVRELTDKFTDGVNRPIMGATRLA